MIQRSSKSFITEMNSCDHSKHTPNVLCNVGSRKESPLRYETWAPSKDTAFEFDFPTSELQVPVTGNIQYCRQSRFQL